MPSKDGLAATHTIFHSRILDVGFTRQRGGRGYGKFSRASSVHHHPVNQARLERVDESKRAGLQDYCVASYRSPLLCIRDKSARGGRSRAKISKKFSIRSSQDNILYSVRTR